jgi:hypothetical protein
VGKKKNRRSAPQRRATANPGRVERIVKSPWFTVSGVLLAALGLVAAVFGPLPELMTQQTEVENFVATPSNKPGVTAYVLPLDAPLEEMPAGVNGYCAEPVIDWLDDVGREIPPYQRITLENTADDGAMLAVRNVRATDVERDGPEPVIHFVCPDGGVGDNARLNLRLDRDGIAERVDEETGDTEPFVFNLQPGEQGTVEIRLIGDMGDSYSGKIVADVTTGGDTATVELPLNGNADGFDRISPGKYARLQVTPGMTAGTFSCSLYDEEPIEPPSTADSELTVCTPTEIRTILAELAS